ncbi:MAG: ABC transporter permease [Flavobacteriaceae bacterium]|nr:ABC transporter permease [Flavobacteriaceae bacterium]
MNTLFKIAWRSLWRNRRRTILTASTVAFAMVLALIMRSMQFGSYDLMIKAGVNQVGDLQVHDSGYWENQSIDRAFFYSKELQDTLKGLPEIKRILPRLETFSLASYGKQTKGILITGIDPVKEDEQNKLSGKIIKGQYLAAEDTGILIGDNLADYLHISVGDSLVLVGQGYQGITAYGITPVKGIFHLPSLQMNSQLGYMNLSESQQFVYPYQPGLLTGLNLFLKDPSQLEVDQNKIAGKLGDTYEVISWKTILTDMLQSIKVDNISGQVMLMILYIIAAFGIFSTVLMMTLEKRKQYAVMVSIGMQRTMLIWVSVLETFIVAVIGVGIGLIIITPVLVYLNLNPIAMTGDMAKMYLEFNVEPILPFSLDSGIFISQTLIILGLSLLSALYPVFYLARFNVLNAFRH